MTLSEDTGNHLEIHCSCPHQDDQMQPQTSSAMQTMRPRYPNMQGEAFSVKSARTKCAKTSVRGVKVAQAFLCQNHTEACH